MLSHIFSYIGSSADTTALHSNSLKGQFNTFTSLFIPLVSVAKLDGTRFAATYELA